MTDTTIRIKKSYKKELSKDCPKDLSYGDFIYQLLLNYRESNNK